MKISDKNSKLGKIPNISIIPVADCGNADSCKKDCYALKAWRQYPTVRKAWRENSEEWRADPFAVASKVVAWIRKKKPRFFRIHVAGDFLSQDHLEAWALIANECQGTKFLAFTKMHDLDFGVCPPNLQIVLSMFPTMTEPTDVDLPRAWCESDKAGNIDSRVPETAVECPGICDTCGMCWQLSKLGRDVVFHNH